MVSPVRPRRTLILLAFGIGLLTSPKAAVACSCVGAGLVDVVPSENIEQPPNTQIHLVYLRDEPGPHELHEDGVRRDDVDEIVDVHGETFLVTVSTVNPLTPGAFVEVFGTEQAAAIAQFTVGADPDDTPPSWDGAFTVTSSRPGLNIRLPGGCGRSRGHGFEWIGLDDDQTPADDLVVVGFPDVEGAASFVDVGKHAGVFDGGLCSHDDSTLKSDFHRTYEVFVEDGAGNRIGPFEVDTRTGCGCASSTPAAAGLWSALVALATLRRRRVH